MRYTIIRHNHGIHIRRLQNQVLAGIGQFIGNITRREYRILGFHSKQLSPCVIDRLTIGIFEIIPTNRFLAYPVVVIDRIIIPQFTELPNHLRTGNKEEQTSGHFQAIHACSMVFRIISACGITIRFQLISHTFFIMTLHVTHQIGSRPCTFLVNRTGDIRLRVLSKSHRPLASIVVHIPPKHQPCRRQFFLFRVIRKMFANDIGIRITFPHFACHPFQVGNTGSIIRRRIIIGIGIDGIRKPFRKIIPETIHPILIHPISCHTIH